MLNPDAGPHSLLYTLPPGECALELPFAGRTEGPEPLAAVGTGAALYEILARERRQRTRECGTVHRQNFGERTLRQRLLVSREHLQQRKLRCPNTGSAQRPIVQARHGACGAPRSE